MSDDQPIPRPVVIKTEKFSPAVNKLIMSDNSVMYACTWPGCKTVAPKPGSVGAHYKAHSGKAAQRRRGERKPRASEPTGLQERLLSMMDQFQELIDEIDAYEDSMKVVRAKADQFDAIKGLLEE